MSFMQREISFFGVTFTVLTFLWLVVAWTISLFSIWPYFMKVNGWVSIFYTLIALLFAGFVNRKLLLLILLVFYFSKTIVFWFQNFMLVLSGFLATFIYYLFVHIAFWRFIGHFLIITFSVFVYYTLIIRVMNVDEE